jgi:hypothetical protein
MRRAHHYDNQQRNRKKTQQRNMAQYLIPRPFSSQHTQLHPPDPSNDPGGDPRKPPSQEPGEDQIAYPSDLTAQQPAQATMSPTNPRAAATTRGGARHPTPGTKRSRRANSGPGQVLTHQATRGTDNDGPGTPGTGASTTISGPTKKRRSGVPGRNTKLPPGKNSKAPPPTAEDKAAAFDTQFGMITQAKPEGSRRLIFGNIGPGGLQQDSESAIQAKRHLIDQYDPDLIGWCEVGAYWPKIPQHQRPGELFKFQHKMRYVTAHNIHDVNKGKRHQQGGTMSMTIGEMTQRLHDQGKDPSGLGRWVWQLFCGKMESARESTPATAHARAELKASAQSTPNSGPTSGTNGETQGRNQGSRGKLSLRIWKRMLWHDR